MSAKILSRPLAIFLLIIFSLTQSIPAGWTSDSVATNEQGIQQPVVPISEAVTPAEEAKSITPPLPALGDELPLSLPEKDIPSGFFEMPRPGEGPKEEPEEKEGGVRELIQADLVNSFGLSEKNIESWMKEGLIRIEVSRDKGTATVYIDPSIQHGSFVNQGGVLVDPLGLKEIPKEIKYQLAEGMQLGRPCFVNDCPEPPLLIVSATFYGNGFDNYVLNYLDEGEPPLGETRLRSVSVYRSDPKMLCGEPPCGTIVRELSFRYEEKGGIQVTVRYPESGKPEISKGTPVSQKILLEEMEDGRYHIQTVEEYDKEGNLLVKNEFEYLQIATAVECLGGPGSICPRDVAVQLSQIARTDSEGNLLSTISHFKDGLKGVRDPLNEMLILTDEGIVTAQVTVADGTRAEVVFATLEELFEEVRKLEARGPEIPAVIQEFVDHLRELLWYRVEVEPSDVEGRYRIRIFPPDGSIRPLSGMPPLILPGQLYSMTFEVALRPEGPVSIGESPVEVLPKYFEVHYEGMPEVDGAMLYEGMLQLAEPGPQGLPNPIAAISLMAEIRVAAVGTNWIDFDYKEARYRIFQEEDGTIVLLDIEKTLALVKDVAQSLRRKDIDLNHDGKLTMEDREGGISRQAIHGAFRVQDLLDPDTLEIYDKRRDGILTRLDIQLFGNWFAHLSGVSVWADRLIAGDYDEEGDGLFKDSDFSLSKVYFQTAASPSVHEWLTEERFRFIDFNQDGKINSKDLPEFERRYGLLIEGQSLLPGARADEMRVVSAEINGPIVFEYQAQRWILYRDASGRVRLEREIPPAVRAFVDQLRRLLSHRMEVEASEVPGRYRIRVFPPDGSVRPLDRMPVLILPGQLHSMSFEVALRPETFPISIGESPVEVLPKYFEVHYAGMPEIDGAMLYEGMLQLAEPGPQGLPNPIAAISLMAKIQISQVDSDGTLHFSYREESWRIYRDQSGKVVLEKEPAEREIKPTLREQILLKRLGKVIAFEKLTATPKNKLMAALHYQFNATGPGTAELTFTIDPCGENSLCGAPVFRATLIVNVRVSFIEFALKKTQEVDLKPGKQQITLNLGDGLRINLPGSLKAGNLIGATERRFPSKPPVIIPLPKPKPPVVITPLPKAKPVTPTDPKKKKKNRR